jgi:hypothetical protein
MAWASICQKTAFFILLSIDENSLSLEINQPERELLELDP